MAGAVALLKKQERAAPLSFYVRTRGEAPTPGVPAAAPGHPVLPPTLSGAVPAASVLRSSARLCSPPCRLLAGASPAALLPSAEVRLYPGGVEKLQTGATDRAVALPLPPLLAVRHRGDHLGAQVLATCLSPQASCLLLEVTPYQSRSLRVTAKSSLLVSVQPVQQQGQLF